MSEVQQTAEQSATHTPHRSDATATAPAAVPSRGVARLLIAPIRGYQRWISPVLPPTCRFYPSCSQYAVESLRVHGPLRGTAYTLIRLAKCGPWHRGGVDHVKPARNRMNNRSTGDSSTASQMDPAGAGGPARQDHPDLHPSAVQHPTGVRPDQHSRDAGRAAGEPTPERHES